MLDVIRSVAEEINATLVQISQAAHATVADTGETLGIAAQLTREARRQEALVVQFQRHG